MKSRLDKKISKANKGKLLEEVAVYLEKLAEAGIADETANMITLSQIMRSKLRHIEEILQYETKVC